MKTHHEIDHELSALRQLEDRMANVASTPRSWKIGIAAQIEVLRDGMRHAEIYSTWNDPDGPEQYSEEMDYAILAARWRDGTNDTPPSADWIKAAQ
jgi:hypothetical protein